MSLFPFLFLWMVQGTHITFNRKYVLWRRAAMDANVFTSFLKCVHLQKFFNTIKLSKLFIDSGGLLISPQMFQSWKLLRSVLQSWHPAKINEFIGGLTQESHQINFSSCIIFSGHSLSNSRHIENILIFTKCANKSFECCCIEQAWTQEIDSGKQSNTKF